MTVVFLRIVENVFVAFILPWSHYACRATGHCNDGVKLWHLSSLLFPVGITSALRPDASPRNDFDENADYVSAFLVALSVVVVSILLLLAQAVTLNGSYLAITGYIYGEWVQVDPKEEFSKIASSNPSQWDPRRRYKKGDVIVVHNAFWFPRQAFYKATFNSPEGRPLDMFWKTAHDIFRNELGHPATSRILAFVIQGHLVFIGALIVIALANFIIRGIVWNGMFTTLIANLVACYGAITAGIPRRSELCQLSNEIR